MKKILIQLSKEFFLPFFCALFWTSYSAKEISFSNAKDLGGTFSGSFFFISWLFSQWHRVSKQQKVEAGLTGIEINIRSMLKELDEKTADLIGYITGGDSLCHFMVSNPIQNNIGSLVAIHEGRHPLSDVQASIVDLDDSRGVIVSRINIHVGDLIPAHAKMLPNTLNLGSGDSRRFNIFFTGKNGGFTQLFRFRRVGENWTYATKVGGKNNTNSFEKVDDSFPRNQDGSVDWD